MNIFFIPSVLYHECRSSNDVVKSHLHLALLHAVEEHGMFT